ncbi:MAG: diguanylate cyclase [Actinobacteria bacterium]|nr:diguanylate cyclase [Actinomycetota bacterium]
MDTAANAPDTAECLDAVRVVLDDLLAARTPQRIAASSCPADARALVEAVDRLVGFMEELAAFVLPLAHGDLSAPMPSRDNAMAAPFVELHSHLSRLTWQAGEIARGDYSQRIDFMGDFSQAFNAMVQQLAERERRLTAEIARRQDAEAMLQRERDLLVAGPLVTFRWEIDDQGTVQYVSPNVSVFGYSADEFLGGRRTYDSVIHPDDLAWVTEEGNEKARSGLETWTQEYRLVDAAGETRWIRDYTHAVRGAEGVVTAYEGYIIDITAQKRAETELRRREEQLRMLSLTDELTGLYNRRGLYALGEHMMRSAQRHKSGMGVVFLDLVGLAAVNERLGHSQGDQALRDLADVLTACIRESDVLARAGGDEFVVLVEDDAAAEALAARIRRRIAAGNAKKLRAYKLEARLGLVFWPAGEAATLQGLLERAGRLSTETKGAPCSD